MLAPLAPLQQHAADGCASTGCGCGCLSGLLAAILGAGLIVLLPAGLVLAGVAVLLYVLWKKSRAGGPPPGGPPSADPPRVGPPQG